MCIVCTVVDAPKNYSCVHSAPFKQWWEPKSSIQFLLYCWVERGFQSVDDLLVVLTIRTYDNGYVPDTHIFSHRHTHSPHSSCIRIAKSVKVLKVTHSFTLRIVRHFVTLDFVRWQRHCRMRHKCQSRWWADLKRNITYFACFSICIFSLCLQMYKVGCRIAAATAAYMQIFEVWFATVKLALHMGKQRKRPIAKLFAVCVCFFPIRICLALHYNRHNVNISEHDECECMCMALRPENIYL